MASKADYAKAAQTNGLLIAEDNAGVCLGIGTRDELEALIRDKILPEETTLRDARPSDF